MTADEIQHEINRLEALKVAAEKAKADEAVEDEKKAARAAAAEALRADRAAKLAVVFEKMGKQAGYVSDRYTYMTRAYNDLLALAEEARGLLDASHLEAGGLGHVELTQRHLLTLCETDLFRIAGAHIVPNGKQEIRRPRGPGAHTTLVEPKFQNSPAAIPTLLDAIKELGQRASKPAPRPMPRLADAPKPQTPTTVAPKIGSTPTAPPQRMSAAEIQVQQQQAAQSVVIDMRRGRI